jgi:hypothetical protein
VSRWREDPVGSAVLNEHPPELLNDGRKDAGAGARLRGNAGREFDRDVRVNVFGLKRSLVAPFDRTIDDDAIWSSRFDFVMVRTGTEAL